MIDRNKQQNKSLELNPKAPNLSLYDVSLFKDNPQFAYIHKKTKKLVSAIYLLSNFISDKEPLKWEMRNIGLSLLSQGLMLSDRNVLNYELTISNYISAGVSFLSVLEVAHLAGLISEMNYHILKYEFENLIHRVESDGNMGNAKGLIFSDKFFDIPEELKINRIPNEVDKQKNEIPNRESFDKGHNTSVSDRLSFRKNNDHLNKAADPKKKDKNNRQELIISLLKKNNELGIKDFTLSIKDCSEKTIQRELVTLVSKGLVNKTGEKRWSRYSLKL